MIQQLLFVVAGAIWLTTSACVRDGKSAEDRPHGDAPSLRSEQSSPFVDPVRASPDCYRVLGSAPGARVLAARLPAGYRDELHSHPTSFWYASTDGVLSIEGPQSSPLRRRIAAGDTGVQGPIALHSVRNSGASDVEILLFEIEPAGSLSKAMPAASAPPALSASSRFQLLEEHAGYRLVLATLKPDQKDELHSHPASLWVALSAVDLRVTAPGQSEVEVHMRSGEARFFESIRAHTVTNLGASTARLLLLEMPEQTARKAL